MAQNRNMGLFFPALFHSFYLKILFTLPIRGHRFAPVNMP